MDLGAIIDVATNVLQSPMASSLLLLGGFLYASKMVRQQVTRVRQELKIALFECREDALKDIRFNASLLALASKYKAVVMSTTGGERSVPPVIRELDDDFGELRRQMHDETNRRAARVARARELLEKQHEEEGLQ